jgi:hypothetical protein
MPRCSLLPLLAFGFALLPSCQSTLKVQEAVPTVAFRGAEVERVQLSMQAEEKYLELALRFGFRNPYSKAFTVPAHEVRFELNGEVFPIQAEAQTAFEVPAEQEVIRTYLLRFDLDPANQPAGILGRDNTYTFTSSFELDLADFGIQLPMGWGRRTLEFSFGDTLRLPLLPIVEPSNEAGQVAFLGTMERLDLGQLRGAMTPMVDLLLEANYPSQAGAGFLQMLDGIRVPSPTLNDPSATIALSAAMVGFLKGFDPNADDKWEAFRAQVAPAGNVKLMDHFVTHFLKPIHATAPGDWQAFKSNWQTFKSQPAVIEYPGLRITGLNVRLPVRLRNPNQFPIQAPSSFLSAQLPNDYHPIRMRAQPSGSPQIPAGGSRTLTLELQLDWSSLDQGWHSLIAGQALTPGLEGETTVDLGYGPTTIEIHLPSVPVQFGGQ